MADDTAQSALYRKRKVFEEVNVHPADYFAAVDDASLIGESALLLGRLVDAVGDEGSEGSIHLLRCQVTYLKSKVDEQCTINDRLRNMIEDLFQASEMRRLKRTADENAQAKAAAESNQKLMLLKNDVEEKEKELAAANEEATFLVGEIINLQKIISAKDRQLEELGELMAAKDQSMLTMKEQVRR